MADIILTTLNARFSHTSLALRSLLANMGPLQQRTQIKEYVINKNNEQIAESLLEDSPKIIGFGVYIWNVCDIAAIIAMIKAVRPDIYIVLGGPEASHKPLRVAMKEADCIISGEGEAAFADLCKKVLAGSPPNSHYLQADPVDVTKLHLPYEHYSDFDLQNRYVYVESSRGCPYKCEFCLSSIDKKVRYFDFEQLLQQLQLLWDRGARDFKFIDRTFNLAAKKAAPILEFFLSKQQDYFVHFEFIPDYFPQTLQEMLARFPKGSLQLEIGIQTLNEKVAQNISRPMNKEKIEQNLRFLQENTHAHLHLDLIIGLPGQSEADFAADLDALMAMGGGEIQLGVLKKLSGTSLHRHDGPHKMVYNPHPPYDVLQTADIDFFAMRRLKRMARFFDIFYNSGNFKQTCQLLFEDGNVYAVFSDFCERFYASMRSTYQIGLNQSARFLYGYMTDTKGYDKDKVAKLMASDLQKVSGRKLPGFLRPYACGEGHSVDKARQRQAKHG
ncbi:MAG: DUF4080 domain-containing protein [Campylobacterota bacterium]